MSFLRPKAPQMPPAPPPPVIEDTAAKEQEQADMLRRRKGRAASVIAEPGTERPVSTAKYLLGN